MTEHRSQNVPREPPNLHQLPLGRRCRSSRAFWLCPRISSQTVSGTWNSSLSQGAFLLDDQISSTGCSQRKEDLKSIQAPCSPGLIVVVIVLFFSDTVSEESQFNSLVNFGVKCFVCSYLYPLGIQNIDTTL